MIQSKDTVGIIPAVVLISSLFSGCVIMPNQSASLFKVILVGVLLISLGALLILLGWWLARNTSLEKWSMKLISAGVLLILFSLLFA